MTLSSSGTGAVYLSGVTQSVTTNLDGLGTAVIDAASGDLPCVIVDLMLRLPQHAPCDPSRFLCLTCTCRKCVKLQGTV